MRTVQIVFAVAGFASVASCSFWHGLTLSEAPSASAEKPLRSDIELTEAKWTAAEADILYILTKEPAECLAPASDKETQYLIDVGRTAFNSPFLLGGQAARARLTCNSCHRRGGDNPDFFIAGLSSKPGTADVTSSIFSKIREDGEFNPVAIPNLIDSAAKSSFGSHGVSAELNAAPESMLSLRAPGKGSLELQAFIASAITDEFQGVPPPQSVLDGLVAYVAHLKSDECASDNVDRTLSADVARIAGMIDAAIESVERGERDTASLLVLTAQNKFVDIYERYNIDGLLDQRNVILDRAQQLAKLRPKVAARKEKIEIELAAFLASLDQFARYLESSSEHSLYNKGVLIELLGLEETEESI
ncbi:MAG: hypothetical protein HKN14_15185 [Marinicaulis sp.]|nr:hypothetical protein [Marinicaulis sp.]